MSKLSLGPVGIALNVSADDAYLKEAAEAEQLGFSAIWLPGGQIDTLDRIARIVGATRSVPVIPGIIALDVYRAAAVAALYAQLQARAPDRFVVGLGGPQQPRPLRPLNGYLDELDRAEPPVRPDGGSWPRSAPASSSWPGTGPPGPSRSWSPPPIPGRRGASSAASPP